MPCIFSPKDVTQQTNKAASSSESISASVEEQNASMQQNGHTSMELANLAVALRDMV